jgi:hypothetical protein
MQLVGLLAHALPAGRIGSRPSGDAPPSGEELIQRRQVDDGRMGDRFEQGGQNAALGRVPFHPAHWQWRSRSLTALRIAAGMPVL